MHLDGERIAKAIPRGARRDTHPSFADAILLDIGFLDALEADTDIACEHVGIVVGALGVGRKTVGQLVGQWFVLLVHSRASISLVSASGLVVGAYRATTFPARS